MTDLTDYYPGAKNVIDRWNMFYTIMDNTDFDRDLDMVPMIEGEVIYVNFRTKVLVSRHRNEFECPFSNGMIRRMCA